MQVGVAAAAAFIIVLRFGFDFYIFPRTPDSDKRAFHAAQPIDTVSVAAAEITSICLSKCGYSSVPVSVSVSEQCEMHSYISERQ